METNQGDPVLRRPSRSLRNLLSRNCSHEVSGSGKTVNQGESQAEEQKRENLGEPGGRLSPGNTAQWQVPAVLWASPFLFLGRCILPWIHLYTPPNSASHSQGKLLIVTGTSRFNLVYRERQLRFAEMGH